MSHPHASPSSAGAEGVSEVLVAGPLRLDVRDERAWLRGEPLRLGGKAFALLHRLMRTPQVLVTKDELFESVWPRLAVSESVLTTAVKEIRQALGDDARRPAFIETVHGRGYRFLPPLAADGPPEPGEVAAAPRRTVPSRRMLLVMAAVLAVAAFAALSFLALRRPDLVSGPHPKSVAVARFADLSPGRQDQWFADGLTEEVLSTLARTPDLRVAARLPAADDPAAAARSRRVAHVLTGTVRRAGPRVRVTVELIRARDGVHVWSQSYDRTGGDIISIQEDVGVQIAQALKTATDPVKLRAMSASGAHTVEAYEAYLRGLALDRRQLEDGDIAFARQADAAFEQARQLDPQFAAAHWRAAESWFGRATRVDYVEPGAGPSEAERMARYLERVDAAIASSEDEVQTLKYRSAKALMQMHFREANALMARYLRARPRDIDAWEEMGSLAAYLGDRRTMARAGRRAFELSAEAGEPRSRAITLMAAAGRYEEAADMGRRLLRTRPGSALGLYQSHRAALYAGRTAEARGYLERLRASSLPEHNKRLAALRQACAEGRTAEARGLYEAVWRDGRLSGRFHAAQAMGDQAAAVRALAPLDTADRLPSLMQFTFYPSFDARAYPNLRARLEADGIAPPRPIPTPARCS